VRAPGESGARTAAERAVAGVPVQPFTWARLRRLARELDVPAPEPL
jgi:LDH2 family malate/lactate/ureidoglycolate dehydrogenase